MSYITHCVLILFSTSHTLEGLDINETLDLDPKWYYEYSVKHVPAHLRSSNVRAKDHEPKTIDIIIKNDKSNPEIVQIAEAHVYRPTATINLTPTEQAVNKRHRRKHTTDSNGQNNNESYQTALGIHFEPVISKEKVTDMVPIDEDNIPVHDKHKGAKQWNTYHKHHPKALKPYYLQAGNRLIEALDHTTTVQFSREPNTIDLTGITTTDDEPNKIKRRHKKRKRTTNYYEDLSSTPLKFSSEHTELTTKFKNKHSKHDADKSESLLRLLTSEKPPILRLLDENYKGKPKDENLYIQPHKVKDNPKVREFTKHVYEQSLKVFEIIKEKIPDYRVQKDINMVMKSYEDKFGDFVRETQEQLIKTRLGTQKVILNTVDTSNRILERLVHYLITKMDNKGFLRNMATEHILINEVKKGAELENKHICTKLKICRSTENYTAFLMGILTTVLNSGDSKLIQLRDAATEVLKDTDLSSTLSYDAEKAFHKALKDVESWDVTTLRGFIAVTKNILKFRNSPIKVIGPINSRVNRTMALLEIFDKWDTMLPPDNSNKLEWNDLQNSFKEWSDSKRTDIAELMQAFVDPLAKTANKLNSQDRGALQKTMNVLLGVNDTR